MKIKNILTIGLVCCGIAAALTSCSKDEDPYFSISDSDAPRILNTDFSRENPDDENSPILFKINRDEHFTFELKVTPVEKSTISWLIEGKEMSNDKKIDIMLEAGTYRFKVVVRANNGKETYRQGTILVSALSNDPNTDSNQKLEFIQAPGTTVKMSGINMSNIKQVRINDRLIDVIKATEGSIEYMLPADMPEGEYRLSLIDESGTSYGAGMVTITNDVIVSQADFLGQSAGNVKISGMNLTNVASVTVDGKACSIVSQEDAKMVVQLPELTEGTFELKATTKSGAAVKFLKDGEFVETASIKVSLIAETILWEGSHAVDWGTIWENAEVTTELKKYAKVGATLRLYVKRTASDYCKGCATVNWTNICTGKGEVVPGDGLRGDIEIADDMTTVDFVLTSTSIDLLNQGNLQVVGHGFDLQKITIIEPAETILWEGSHAVDWGTIWEDAEITTTLKARAGVGSVLRLYVKRTASDYCKGCATVNWTNICTGKGEVVPGDGLRGDIDITDDMNTIEFVLTETSMNLLNQGNLQVVGHGFDLLKITIQ